MDGVCRRKRADEDFCASLINNAHTYQLKKCCGVFVLYSLTDEANFKLDTCTELTMVASKGTVYLKCPQEFSIQGVPTMIDRFKVDQLCCFQDYLQARKGLSHEDLLLFVKDTGVTRKEALGFL